MIRVAGINHLVRRVAGNSAIGLQAHHVLPEVQVLIAETLLSECSDTGREARSNGETPAVRNHPIPHAITSVKTFEDRIEIMLREREVITDVG